MAWHANVPLAGNDIANELSNMNDNFSYLRGTFSAGVNGYIVHHSGVIIQWGFLGSVTNAGQALTWPIAFPNAVFSIVTNVYNRLVTSYAQSPTVTGCTLFVSDATLSSVYWMATGN